VKAGESYEVLKEELGLLITEINSVAEKGVIVIDGTQFSLEVFLAADYKFLLATMGLGCATSDYACLWCLVSKKERY